MPERRYTATEGLINLLYKLQNGAKVGTGITEFKQVGINLLGNELPPALVSGSVDYLNNLFGGYPTQWDFAPSIVFSVLFFILGFAHLGLFIINTSRGHLFYMSAAWCMIAFLKGIGFALRARWAQDILQVDTGLTSELFLIVSSVFLISVNLVLAQRLFTWRHPVGGDRRLFKYTMYVLYAIVALVIALTVVSSFVPYLYFISRRAARAYAICVMFSAILIILYSLTAISLLGLSYFFKPTRKDENLYTYQPWWVELFHPFYFVKKNAARDAEDTFMKRNHNHRHAVRVIAATNHIFNMVEGLSNQRGDLKHNKSIIIVTFTTLLTFVQAILRAIACFQFQPNWYGSVVSKPIVAIISWGALEVLVHLLYLVGRCDLRFYKPDILPAKVRSIITAEQSFFASRNRSPIHSEDEESEISDFEDLNSSTSRQPPGYDDKMEVESSNDNESDFRF